MPRFEVNEEVIIKEVNTTLYRGVITRIINNSPSINFWEAIPFPVYDVSRRNSIRHRFALDNKDRCKYAGGFPFCRIYKLEEV